MATSTKRKFRASNFLQICVLFCIIASVLSRSHTLHVKDDQRKQITCSTFGFLKNGYLSVTMGGFTTTYTPTDTKVDNNLFGFTLDKTYSSGISPYLENKEDVCAIKNPSLAKDESVAMLFFILNLKDKRLDILKQGKDFKNIQITTMSEEAYAKAIRNDRSVTSKRGPSSILHMLHKRDVKDNKIPDAKVMPTTLKNETPKEAAKGAGLKTGSVTGKTPPATPKSTTPAAAVDKAAGNVVSKFLPVNGSIPLHYFKESINVHFVVAMKRKEEEGLYNLFFHNCGNYGKEPLHNTVNFTLNITEKNAESYLSAGEIPLPSLYFALCVLFMFTGCFWFFILRKSKEGVYKIHYLMLGLMFVKSIAFLFHGINYHFIGKEGFQEEGWAVVYYITHLMKGALLFITIVLIGAGWAFIKHMLSDRDKKIFLIVIPLQILANVAQIIIEESEEGTTRYTTWKEVFILVDLLCCGAILFPVVWSIRHLQEGSQTDGKAAINLRKLKLFRHFYIMITVPFQFQWLDELFKETATFVFFVITGYKFRPATDNPYLQVPMEEEEFEMDEVLTESGALETVTKVINRSSGGGDSVTKQRESSHEYD
ncbi:protein GPR107-like isoform X2 [Lineus longissimus]|uniref:protein GPR107-like isoform X2 n=1 Tax=Lineus longissimus TaxID=88925 RepID=UPI00315CF321